MTPTATSPPLRSNAPTEGNDNKTGTLGQALNGKQEHYEDRWGSEGELKEEVMIMQKKHKKKVAYIRVKKRILD